MTADILIREDTGTHATVRVIDPGMHVSAPYSRAIGLLDKWVTAERRAVDEFAAWIEGQAAQAHAEMRALCDELGLPVAWAEIPDQPGSVKRPELPPDPAAELSPEQLDREYALNNMVRQARRGWTPQRPLPALTPTPEGTYTQPGAVDTTERRDWSAEWGAFRDDVKDMARDLRQSLTWWRR